MLAWKLSSLNDVYPAISGLSYQASVTLPEKSLLLNIYQDSKQAETRYLPVQALQTCFRYNAFKYPYRNAAIKSSATKAFAQLHSTKCLRVLGLNSKQVLAFSTNDVSE